VSAFFVMVVVAFGTQIVSAKLECTGYESRDIHNFHVFYLYMVSSRCRLYTRWKTWIQLQTRSNLLQIYTPFAV
ncbi:hypothetical protein AC249_AIPGENE14809, partial [Exaiptasia diaphana]